MFAFRCCCQDFVQFQDKFQAENVNRKAYMEISRKLLLCFARSKSEKIFYDFSSLCSHSLFTHWFFMQSIFHVSRASLVEDIKQTKNHSKKQTANKQQQNTKKLSRDTLSSFDKLKIKESTGISEQKKHRCLQSFLLTKRHSLLSTKKKTFMIYLSMRNRGKKKEYNGCRETELLTCRLSRLIFYRLLWTFEASKWTRRENVICESFLNVNLIILLFLSSCLQYSDSNKMPSSPPNTSGLSFLPADVSLQRARCRSR